jgi:hypothetical protein
MSGAEMSYRESEHHDPAPTSATFAFEWLGSEDHADCDFRGDSYVSDYCCAEGEYELVVPFRDYDDWAVGGPNGWNDPCDNLQRVVDCYLAHGEAGMWDDAVLAKYGLGRCETCGGHYVLGDVPQPMYGHTHKVAEISSEAGI